MYIVGTHWNHLAEVIPMSIHNICVYGYVRKYQTTVLSTSPGKGVFAWHFRTTDKRGYPHNIFLISQRIHMLWVLIRSASPRCF